MFLASMSVISAPSYFFLLPHTLFFTPLQLFKNSLKKGPLRFIRALPRLLGFLHSFLMYDIEYKENKPPSFSFGIPVHYKSENVKTPVYMGTPLHLFSYDDSNPYHSIFFIPCDNFFS